MRRAGILAPVVALVLVGCGEPARSTSSAAQSSFEAEVSNPPSASPTPPSAAESVETLVAAGDIAACDRDGDAQTAALVAEVDGVVAILGDSVYPNASEATFAECFEPTWGAFAERIRPAVGNHDIGTDGGAAYQAYYGDRAGRFGEWWYSYDIGAWHAVVLNSHCELIACGPGSPQHDWLVDDLNRSDARCTVAYMHHPLFNSGPYGEYQPVAPLYEALHDAGVDLVLAGHEHLYERFGPQTAAGEASGDGIRQFTVGTGGHSTRIAPVVAPNSERIIDDAFGVLVLELRPDSYDWSFRQTDGSEGDSGSAPCH